MRRVLLFATGLVVLFSCIACLFVQRPTAEDASAEDIQTVVGDSVTRVLFLGCDRAAGLTDSIMVLALEETTGRVSVLQIPRDTYAAYTDRDYKKLNGALSTLGLSGVKRLLSEGLGVPITYAVSMDLDCVSDVVDAVGGVDIHIPRDMFYTDDAQGLTVAFSAGDQHLDGAQAERFLRFRSGYANADIGRLDAQKQFLQAFWQACEGLNASTVARIIWAVFPRMQTDLPLPEAMRLTNRLMKGETTECRMLTAPGEAVQGTSGAWYYSLNKEGMCRAVNEYLMPSSPLSPDMFDPNGIFDRTDHPDFHRIYLSPAPTWEGENNA